MEQQTLKTKKFSLNRMASAFEAISDFRSNSFSFINDEAELKDLLNTSGATATASTELEPFCHLNLIYVQRVSNLTVVFLVSLVTKIPLNKKTKGGFIYKKERTTQIFPCTFIVSLLFNKNTKNK